MDAHALRARELFESGWNCAQSLLLAFTEETGLDEKTAARLASSFGGGMGRLREVCGALSASFMVLGLIYGDYPPDDGGQKAAHYMRVQELAAVFRERRGTLLCRELLGKPEGADHYVPSARTPEYYAARPCAAIIEEAAGALAAYLRENPSCKKGEKNL